MLATLSTPIEATIPKLKLGGDVQGMQQSRRPCRKEGNSEIDKPRSWHHRCIVLTSRQTVEKDPLDAGRFPPVLIVNEVSAGIETKTIFFSNN